MLQTQIANFWTWFTKRSDKLHSDNYDRSVLDELDVRICDWGLTWEIGPGFSKIWSLTISPGGDKTLLDKAKTVIDNAPQLSDWEFYFAKQEKKNWHIARLFDLNIEINASDWTYVILTYADHKNEVLLKADNLAEFDKKTQLLAADLILTNLLGEELKMEKIDFFDIVTDFDFDSKKGITKLKFLPAHITDKHHVK